MKYFFLIIATNRFTQNILVPNIFTRVLKNNRRIKIKITIFTLNINSVLSLFRTVILNWVKHIGRTFVRSAVPWTDDSCVSRSPDGDRTCEVILTRFFRVTVHFSKSPF